MHRQLQNFKKCNIKLKIAKLCVDKSVNLDTYFDTTVLKIHQGIFLQTCSFYLMLPLISAITIYNFVEKVKILLTRKS